MAAVVQRLRTDAAFRLMDAVSYYGRGWSLTLLAALAVVLGCALHKKRLSEAGVLSLFGLVLATVAVHLVKHLAGRPRPRLLEHMYAFSGPNLRAGLEGLDSFPSGHAVSTFAIAAIVGHCYPKARWWLGASALTISFSRVFVGAHYFSDVVAGSLLGLLCGSFLVRLSDRALGLYERIERQRQHLFLGATILAISGIVFFYRLGAFSLFDVDEAVFAQAAREMLATGDWLTPTYNGTPRYDKPILIYWLMSASFALFGESEFAARFWSASAGCALVLATFLFARAAAGLRCALFSSLILMTSLEVLLLTHLAITDMVLTLFIAASSYGFYCALQRYPEPPSCKWAMLGWAAAALAVLTKGPIGILFPLASSALFIWRARLSAGWAALRPLPGSALFCAIALPWYAAESFVTGGEFPRVFFLAHNVARYLSVNSGHQGPWYYYLIVIAVGFLPWTVFLPASLRAAWRCDPRAADDQNRLPAFLLCWIGIVLIFFSLGQTKLPNYVAPLFPALSIAVGWWADRFLFTRRERARLAACVGCATALSLGIFFVLAQFRLDRLMSALGSARHGLSLDLGWAPLFLAFASAAAASAFLFLLRARSPADGFAAIAASTMIFSFGLFEGLLPRVAAHLQEPLRAVTKIAAQTARPEDTLIVFGLNRPSVLFYARRPVTILRRQDINALEARLKSPERSLVITSSALARTMIGVHTIAERNGYVVLSNQNVALR